VAPSKHGADIYSVLETVRICQEKVYLSILIEICMREMFNRIRVGEYLIDGFLRHYELNQSNAGTQ
jgi:hypothetical protein